MRGGGRSSYSVGWREVAPKAFAGAAVDSQSVLSQSISLFVPISSASSACTTQFFPHDQRVW